MQEEIKPSTKPTDFGKNKSDFMGKIFSGFRLHPAADLRHFLKSRWLRLLLKKLLADADCAGLKQDQRPCSQVQTFCFCFLQSASSPEHKFLLKLDFQERGNWAFLARPFFSDVIFFAQLYLPKQQQIISKQNQNSAGLYLLAELFLLLSHCTWDQRAWMVFSCF